MRAPTDDNPNETTCPQCTKYALIPQLLFFSTAPLLLGMNLLATFAPEGGSNSIGKELLLAMRWNNAATSDKHMQALSLKTSLVSLFPIAVLFSLYIQCVAAHLTDHEERELSEAAKLPILYKHKKTAFISAASYLTASNIPIQAIGTFLFAFFDEKKSWNDTLYITTAITFSTFVVTMTIFFLYKITGYLYALFEPKTPQNTTQRTIETQTDNPENHPPQQPVLVIQNEPYQSSIPPLFIQQRQPPLAIAASPNNTTPSSP